MAGQRASFRRPQSEGTSEPSDRTVDELQPSWWPRDENGEPMIRVDVQAREHISLTEIGMDYSNITVGPSGATMFVRRGQDSALTDDEKKALASCINELHEVIEVDVIAKQRDVFLDSIKPG